MSVQAFGVQRQPGFFIQILAPFEKVKLHADGVDPCPLELGCLGVGVIFVGGSTAVLPAGRGVLVDDKLIVREILFSQLEASLNVVGLVVKFCLALHPFHLVCDLNGGDLVSIARSDLGVSLFKSLLYLVNVRIIEPLGEECIVC